MSNNDRKRGRAKPRVWLKRCPSGLRGVDFGDGVISLDQQEFHSSGLGSWGVFGLSASVVCSDSCRGFPGFANNSAGTRYCMGAAGAFRSETFRSQFQHSALR